LIFYGPEEAVIIKFDKIKHILEFYPNLQYVLIGDDSQHDPQLYEAIAKIFPLTAGGLHKTNLKRL
jgi:phosphatidate phosphatase APP1